MTKVERERLWLKKSNKRENKGKIRAARVKSSSLRPLEGGRQAQSGTARTMKEVLAKGGSHGGDRVKHKREYQQKKRVFSRKGSANDRKGVYIQGNKYNTFLQKRRPWFGKKKGNEKVAGRHTN